MPNSQKPLCAVALYALLLAGLHNFSEPQSTVSLKAYYQMSYGGPGLAPMTPSMNPNPGMYFPQGGGPQGGLPGQPYQAMPMPPMMGGGYPPSPYGGPQMGMPPMGGGMPPMGGGMADNPAGLDPNDPVQQALSLHQAGRYADAIQIYESIIINNPPDPRIYASISDAHFRLGNTERSLKYCVEALKLDPNYASGHLLMGTILGEMGDVVRAVRSYERVIALDQNNPYAYYNLGLLYYKKSDIRVALEFLERARDLNPNDPKIWNNLGVAYYDNGQLSKAAAAYSQALGLDPMYETAKRNLELVQGKMPSVAYAQPKRVVRSGHKKKASSSAKKKKVVKKK